MSFGGELRGIVFGGGGGALPLAASFDLAGGGPALGRTALRKISYTSSQEK
jgi:hypothetical protein